MTGRKRSTKRKRATSSRNGIPQTAEHQAFMKRVRAEHAAFRKRSRR